MYMRNPAKRLRITALAMVLTMIISLFGGISVPAASAANKKAVRTIMYYNCGSDPETNNSAATNNLLEAMNAEFDNEDVRFIVMTGGANQWHMESKYLKDKNGNGISEISNEYNQIWELTGKTASGEAGSMTLLDGDGVTGDGSAASTSEEELMNDPETLKGFINWAKANYPADNYDLICWDHGSGAAHGFGKDEHYLGTEEGKKMPVCDIARAVSGCNVEKFDLIEFDCCMMASFETVLALSDYTDYYIGSPDVVPLTSLDYTALLNHLGQNPGVDTKELGRWIVDNYVSDYAAERTIGNAVALSMVDMAEFKKEALKENGLVDKMQLIAELLRKEAEAKSFYDELRTTNDDFSFYYSTLHDLGSFVEQLGIHLDEWDAAKDSGNAALENEYTQVAKDIQEILKNEDVIYTRETSLSKKDQIVIGRKSDGTLEVRPEKIIPRREGTIPEGSLNIFFFANSSSTTRDVIKYINGMNDLKKVLKNNNADSKVINFLSSYRQAVIDYELIFDTGEAVSKLKDSGKYTDDEIDFEKVKDYFQSQGEWNQISKIIRSRSGETEKWLGEVIDVQKKELLNPKDDVTVKKDGENYRVNIVNTPKRIIDVPVLELSTTTDTMPDYLNDVHNLFRGERSFDADQEGGSIEDLFNSTSSSYLAPKIDRSTWPAVEDSKGVKHIASLDSDNSVDVQFEFSNGDCPSGSVLFNDDGSINSICVETKPMEIESLTTEVKATLLNHEKNVHPISDPFVIDQDTKLVNVRLSDVGAKNVDAKLSVCDIYAVEHDITEKLKAVDDYNLSYAKVTLSKTSLNYTGKVQKPTVKSVIRNGAAVPSGAYTVTYKNSSGKVVSPKDAGTYYVCITGKGLEGYYGEAKASFKINPVANTIRLNKKAVTKPTTFNVQKKTIDKKASVYTVTRNGKGKISITNKSASKLKKYLSLSGSKVTLKKKAPKGTYKFTITVAANSNWKKTTSKLISIRVK